MTASVVPERTIGGLTVAIAVVTPIGIIAISLYFTILLYPLWCLWLGRLLLSRYVTVAVPSQEMLL